MALYSLQNGDLRLAVSSTGGVIEGLWRQDMPLLREGKNNGVATDSSCFPLVPFGNRVSGNRFEWQGKTYPFAANVDWDSHYLHGDGWLGEWQCGSQSADALTLVYQHRHGVYRYLAQQAFHLQADRLTVTLSVTNEGEETLPFGLGWHPFFPLTPETLIQAKAQGYWLEREQWLAGEFCEHLPPELDFSQPSPLPRRWLNNGFAHWDGVAHIFQPQAGYQLTMETTPPAPCYFLFVSDPAFDEGYQFEFFCFEPMSHAPDDHHRPGAGELTLLAPGGSTTMSMTLHVASLS
ncbi:aldose 1-epimerase [Enterobacteriaceae bacterium RIT691]|nr:aldose 1-epimerase [Enterobacteriaceae bacterium RIT691]